MDDTDKLLTMPEVAAIARTSVDTLRYYRTIGKGPQSFKLGRRVLYRASDVNAWVDAGIAAEQQP